MLVSKHLLLGFFSHSINPGDRLNTRSVLDRDRLGATGYESLRSLQHQVFARAERCFMSSLEFTNELRPTSNAASLVAELLEIDGSREARPRRWFDRHVPTLGQTFDTLLARTQLNVERGSFTRRGDVRETRPRDRTIDRYGLLISSASGRSASTLASQIQGRILAQTQDEYELTAEPPFFARRADYTRQLSLLLVDALFTPRDDPQKPLRALSMAGWVVASAQSTSSMFAMIDQALSPRPYREESDE
jgi:hypothetical protein